MAETKTRKAIRVDADGNEVEFTFTAPVGADAATLQKYAEAAAKRDAAAVEKSRVPTTPEEEIMLAKTGQARQQPMELGETGTAIMRGVAPTLTQMGVGAGLGLAVGGPPGAAFGALTAPALVGLGDIGAIASNKFLGANIPTPSSLFQKGMTAAGVPEVQTERGGTIQSATDIATSAVAPSRLALRGLPVIAGRAGQIAEALSGAPIKTTVAGEAGLAATEATDNPVVGLATSLLLGVPGTTPGQRAAIRDIGAQYGYGLENYVNALKDQERGFFNGLRQSDPQLFQNEIASLQNNLGDAANSFRGVDIHQEVLRYADDLLARARMGQVGAADLLNAKENITNAVARYETGNASKGAAAAQSLNTAIDEAITSVASHNPQALRNWSLGKQTETIGNAITEAATKAAGGADFRKAYANALGKALENNRYFSQEDRQALLRSLTINPLSQPGSAINAILPRGIGGSIPFAGGGVTGLVAQMGTAAAQGVVRNLANQEAALKALLAAESLTGPRRLPPGLERTITGLRAMRGGLLSQEEE